MEITEKEYIEGLEKMVKEHKKDVCDHCPAERLDFTIEKGWCVICDELFEKYVEKKEPKLTSVYSCGCPCNYFKVVFREDGEEMSEDFMVKIAWKMIRGWKKDNKKEK